MDNWSLENELGFKIMKTAKNIEKQVNENLYNFGLTLAQGKIILTLGKNKVVNQRILSESLDVEPATIVRTLDRMERDGFIKRERDPSDRRVHIIHLTDRAKNLVTSLKSVMSNSFSKIVNIIDEEDQSLIKEKLDLINNKDESKYY